MQGNAVSRRYCTVCVWHWNLHRNTQRSTVTACCGYAGFAFVVISACTVSTNCCESAY